MFLLVSNRLERWPTRCSTRGICCTRTAGRRAGTGCAGSSASRHPARGWCRLGPPAPPTRALEVDGQRYLTFDEAMPQEFDVVAQLSELHRVPRDPSKRPAVRTSNWCAAAC